MKIRFATPEDLPSIVEVGQRFHAATRFAAYDYNSNRVANQLRAVLVNPGTHCLLVAADSEGNIVGLLIGCIERHIFSDQPVASVIHYDVLPEKRMGGAGVRLLTAFRKWAENRSAYELSAGVNSGVNLDQTDRFLRRLGFHLTGGNYSLALRKHPPAAQTGDD